MAPGERAESSTCCSAAARAASASPALLRRLRSTAVLYCEVSNVTAKREDAIREKHLQLQHQHVPLLPFAPTQILNDALKAMNLAQKCPHLF